MNQTDLDAVLDALAGPAGPAWPPPPDTRVVTTWTDEATGLRCAMRPTAAFPGGWCAYLDVPEGAALEDIGAPADWVGSYEGMPGWDTGHPWTEGWTEEQVRAELTRQSAVALRLAREPRWDGSDLDRVALGMGTPTLGIYIHVPGEGCKGGIRVEKKPRGIRIEWWRWTPKSCKQHKAASVEEAALAIVAAGAPVPPPEMVSRLAAWMAL